MQEDGSMLMRMLTERVPLTLLLDLVSPPDAEELYHVEGGAAEWLRGGSMTAVPAAS